VARLDIDVPGGFRLSAALALGSSSFSGSRGVPSDAGTGAARLAADLPMAGVDTGVGWSVPSSGAVSVDMGARLAWRHVGLGKVAETGAAGLAIQADGGRHQRLEIAAGGRIALAQSAMGPWRLSGHLGAKLIQGLCGAPESVLARLKDMPDTVFELVSSGAPSTRLGLTAGMSLLHAPSGARLTLGAARGDARSAASLSLGAGISLDF